MGHDIALLKDILIFLEEGRCVGSSHSLSIVCAIDFCCLVFITLEVVLIEVSSRYNYAYLSLQYPYCNDLGN